MDSFEAMKGNTVAAQLEDPTAECRRKRNVNVRVHMALHALANLTRGSILMSSSTLLVIATCAGCGRDAGPPSNSTPTSPMSPSRAVSVSGTVVDREGGPLAGVGVWLDPGFRTQQFPGGTAAATTDARGSFSLQGLLQASALYFRKQGWEDRLATVGNRLAGVTTDTVVNLTMTRRLEIAPGETIRATIWGDDVLDYEEFLDRCHLPSVCRLIRVTTRDSGVLISQIRWSEATNRLGLSLYTDDGYQRHDANVVPSFDGSNTLKVSAEVFGSGIPTIVVRFEQSNGGSPPGADDSQAFELTTSFR
jgi:hypothetical protein